MRNRSWGSRDTLRVAVMLVVAALLLALVDTIDVGLTATDRGASLGSVLELGLVSGALLIDVALLLGAASGLAAWVLAPLWRRRGARRLVAVVGVLTLAGACWALAVQLLSGAGVTRVLGSARTLATVALCGVLVGTSSLAFVGAAQLVRRRPRLGSGAVLGWGLGLLCVLIFTHLVDRRLYVGLYPEIHSVLTLGTSVMAVALLWWFGLLRNTRPKVLVVAGLVAVIIGIAAGAYAHRALTAQQTLLAAIHNETTFARGALSVMWSIVDLDQDGHSPVMGGGDCDDMDSDTHPGALEVAGNGVDEDCMGGDLPALPVARRSTAGRTASATSTPSDSVLPDILLFSVDALRADRLPCDGSARSAAPTMDEVAMRGTCFTNTYVTSTSSATSLPAIAAGSHFSNLYPEVKTGGSASPRDRLPVPTILNDLASRGYRVIATVPTSFRAYFLDEGIEWSAPSGLGTPNLDQLLRQIEDGPDVPLALWFHHMDAHLSFTREFLRESHGTGPNAEVNERYDAAVRRVDRDLGILLEWQSQRSGLDNTIIVITADHGDELAEHGGFGHARTLYEEVIRVPLIISWPGSGPRVVGERVSIVDLAPTLRELVGLDPAHRSDGISLVPWLEGQVRPHPPIYAENFLSSKNRAVVWADWKLIFTVPGNVYELYDLRTDPGEHENLADAHPARLLALQKLLALCSANGCRDIDPELLEDVERTLTSP